jgi:hypothetical protein
MENTPKFKIDGNVGYPSQLDPFEVKKTPEWGLNLARAIQGEWFYNYFGSACRFYTQRRDFLERRMYAKGQQPISKFFKSLGTNGDLSRVNLMKKPITIIPKLSDVVVNGFANRKYSIVASGVDQVSQDDKLAYRKQVEDAVFGKEYGIKIKEQLGIDVLPMSPDAIPESNNELKLHLELDYKPSIEMSNELLIEAVMNDNDYDSTTLRRKYKDLVDIGICWEKTSLCPNKGITVEYVFPENKLQSYTEDPYFRDCFYHGEFKTVLISDVLIEFPHIAGDENIINQLNSVGNWWNNYHTIPQNQRINGTCNLLYFTYKTTRENFNKIKEKSTGEKIVSKADPYFDESKKHKNDKYKRVSKVEEVLFEGVYLLGTDILLRWEVAENMARPNSNKQKVCEKYVGVAPNMEKGFIDSLVYRMMGIDDLIQICQLKIQIMIQQMIPDGYQIDLDAYAELDLGDGKVLTPIDHFNFMMQTGSAFVRSYGAGGDFNYAKVPLTELRSAGNITKIQALAEKIEGYKNDQREVIGLNKASDASTPDKDSLVGLQKLAALNSNTATRHILDASNENTRRIAEAITYRVFDIIKYFPELKKDLIRKIGATSVADLEHIDELPLRDFAIFLNLELDEEEKAKLEQDMSLAIEKGWLLLQDKYKVLGIKNFKQAIAYLSVLIEKYQRKQQEMEMQKIQANTQSQTQIAQSAEQGKQQTSQMEIQGKMQLQELTNKGLVDKERVKGEEDRATLQLKIQGDKEIAEIDADEQKEKLEYVESKKDMRSAKEAEQQSQLLVERAKEQPNPVDFQSQEAENQMFELDESQQE